MKIENLEKVIEMLSKAADKSDCDDIAALSIKKEHQKFVLANSINCKKLYLHILNMALMQEHNLYAFSGGILTEAFTVKEGVKQMKESFDSLLKGLENLGKALLDDADKDDDEKCSHD